MSPCLYHLPGGFRYPEGDLDTNLTIVITNVGADFTRLGSFGDAEQFGGNVVAQMDRSYLNRSWNKPKSPVQVPTTYLAAFCLNHVESVCL